MHRFAPTSILVVAVVAMVALTGAGDPGAADDPAPWATEGSTGWIVAAVGVLALAAVVTFLVIVRRRAQASSAARDR